MGRCLSAAFSSAKCARLVWLAVATIVLARGAQAATEVLTNNYDDSRTGANLSEGALTTANVKPESFGRLFSYEVDGPQFAQPLVATAVKRAREPARDIVYLATANNSVYAFDAAYASASAGALLWQRQLNRSPQGALLQVSGIFSTPVIDRAGEAIYVVAGLIDGGRARFVLHALDLVDGGDKYGGPVTITGSVAIDQHRIVFEPTARRIAVQRAALALAKDKVIVAFGGDYFEGWVFAFDKGDLRAPPAAFCTTCASRVASISAVDYDSNCILLGPGGGIWQSGRAPVVDANGIVYFFTGNKQHVIKDGCTIATSSNACAACAQPGGCVCAGNRSSKACRGPDACVANAARDGKAFDTNEALIALDPGAGLKLTGWFRPENWNAAGVHGLEVNDLDLGGSGPLLMPGSTRLIGGGKQGVMYLFDTNALAFTCNAASARTCRASVPEQSFQLAPIPPQPKEFYRHLLGGPVLWPRAGAQGSSLAYVWRQNDYLRSYRVSDRFEDCNGDDPAPTTTHNCASVARSEEFIDHHPGGILTLSANGGDAASAIVWAAAPRMPGGPGKLMAFKAVPDAATPSRLNRLWDSDACAGDGIAIGADFVPPTVANGRVYVATGANRVEVYGLIKPRACVPVARPDPVWQILQ